MTEIVGGLIGIISIIAFFIVFCIMEDILSEKIISIGQLIFLIIFFPITFCILFGYFLLSLVVMIIWIFEKLSNYDFLILDFNKTKGE